METHSAGTQNKHMKAAKLQFKRQKQAFGRSALFKNSHRKGNNMSLWVYAPTFLEHKKYSLQLY